MWSPARAADDGELVEPERVRDRRDIRGCIRDRVEVRIVQGVDTQRHKAEVVNGQRRKPGYREGAVRSAGPWALSCRR